MKRILLPLLFVLPIHLLGQNWNTIVTGDSLYYTVQASGLDSDWNHYLRAIWADSSVTSGGITTNYFYRSLRPDENNIMNLTTNATWLGKKNIRNLSGEEYYFNQFGDSLFIKTLAGIGDNWIFCKDSNNVSYKATVVSKNTQLIDGIIDSVKTIQLQAYQGALPIASTYNSLPIVLSKSHGFYSMFEFFAFPYWQWVATNDTLPIMFPLLPLIHQRLNRDITESHFMEQNTLFIYQPGNEWQWYSDLGSEYDLYHDSIISTSYLSPTTLEVTKYRHKFYQIFGPIPSMGHIYTTTIDTLVIDSISFAATVRTLLPENLLIFDTLYGYRKNFYFIKPFCTNKIIYRYEYYHNLPPLSTGTFEAGITEYIQGFGKTDSYWEKQFSFRLLDDYFYMKLGSCTDGTKYNFKALSSTDINERTNSITVFPNPTSGRISIISSQVTILKIILHDITGKELMSQDKFKANNSIEISNYPDGVYLLEIQTDKGIVNRKVIKGN